QRESGAAEGGAPRHAGVPRRTRRSQRRIHDPGRTRARRLRAHHRHGDVRTMSTFSGLGTAASALAAARRGMDVVGQNIANQQTEGYTRQRVSTSAIPAATLSTRFGVGAAPGHGVSVDGIARLGDALLDARVRESSSSAGFWSARALAATAAEAAMAEPGEHGLSARLSKFWTGWQDLGIAPDSGAAAAAVSERAAQRAAQVAAGHRAWAAERRGTL